MNVEEFVKAARKGVVTVEFKKIDTGELRVMPCTLDPEKLPSKTEVKSQNTQSEHVVVWSLDKEAWRSFRVNTVVRWYEGDTPADAAQS